MRVAVIAFAHSIGDVRVYDKEVLTLQAAGHSVFLLARKKAASGRAVNTSGQESGESNNDITRILFAPRPRSLILRALLEPYWLGRYFFAAIRLNVDVVHCHEPQSLLLGLILGKLKRVKVVYDCHEYQPESSAELFPAFLQPILLRLFHRIEWFVAARVDAVVTVNDELAGRFREHCPRVIVLQNYPLAKTFDVLPDPKTVSEDVRSLAKHGSILVYHGSLSEERGLLHCVELIRRLQTIVPNVQLWIIGGSRSPAFMAKLKARIEDGLTERVRLLPWMSHRKLREYLSLADIGLFLPDLGHDRYRRAEPVKFFEYAASAVAVIMSDVPALRSLLAIADNGVLVDPAKIDETADIVAQLLSDKTRLHRAKCNGRRVFFERFHWNAVSDRLVRLYEELALASQRGHKENADD